MPRKLLRRNSDLEVEVELEGTQLRLSNFQDTTLEKTVITVTEVVLIQVSFLIIGFKLNQISK